MRPSIARDNEQLDPRFAASLALIIATQKGLHPVACKLLLICRLTEVRRLS